MTLEGRMSPHQSPRWNNEYIVINRDHIYSNGEKWTHCFIRPHIYKNGRAGVERGRYNKKIGSGP